MEKDRTHPQQGPGDPGAVESVLAGTEACRLSLGWEPSAGVDVVIPFPECYLKDQATGSGIRWLLRAATW